MENLHHTDSPLSYQEKIQSNYRLPPARAQGGEFSRRSRNAPRPVCVRTHEQREPHIHLDTEILSGQMTTGRAGGIVQPEYPARAILEYSHSRWIVNSAKSQQKGSKGYFMGLAWFQGPIAPLWRN